MLATPEKANKLENVEIESVDSNQSIHLQHSRVAHFLLGSKMQPVPKNPEPSTEHTINLWSKMFWSWLTPLMYMSYNRRLDFNDVFELDERDKLETQMAIYRLKTKEYEEAGSHSPHLKALFYITRHDVLWGSFHNFVSASASICQSVVSRMLTKLIQKIYKGDDNMYGKGTGYAIANTLLIMINLVCHIWSIYYLERYQFVLRNTIAAAVHDKALRLSPYGRAQYSTSAIHSLITVDIPRVAYCGRYLFNGPVEMPLFGVATGLLIWYIGPIALTGVALVILSVLISMASGPFIKKCRIRAFAHSDQRVSSVRETISHMKIVKLYGWENAFISIISAARKLEEVLLISIMRANVLVNAATAAVPHLSGLMVFAAMSALHRELDAAAIFPAVTLFNMLTPLSFAVTQWFLLLVNANVCFKRLELFFEADEGYVAIEPLDDEKTSISIENASFKYLKDLPKPLQLSFTQRMMILLKIKRAPAKNRNIHISDGSSTTCIEGANLDVKKGELIFVTGATGSGKTNLLKAIAGFMIKDGGSLHVNGNVTTVLDNWCLNASVRENIVFGGAYNDDLYRNVIEACGLEQDIRAFENGDLTEVGEQGSNLSGGQKVRLALARGCYSAGDIVLIDDVCNAVDSRVGKTIMNKCICQLLNGKTRVVVSNDPIYLNRANKIVFLLEGTLRTGTFDELIKDRDFSEFIDGGPSVGSRDTTSSEEKDCSEALPENKYTQKKLMKEEVLEHGDYSLDMIKYYIKCSGKYPVFNCLLIVLVIILLAALDVMESIFLSWWSADRFHETKGFYIGIYAALIVGYCLCDFAFFSAIARVLYKATSKLHNIALSNVYRAPMVFFDTNPLGLIVDRFTNDLAWLDTIWFEQFSIGLPTVSSSCSEYVLLFVYVPWSIIGVIPIVVVGAVCATYYRYASPDVNRMMNIFRGQQTARITENIDGCNAIIGHGRQEYFENRVYYASDRANSAVAVNQGTIFWFASRVVLTFLPIDFIVAMLCVCRVVKVSPATAGLLFSTLPSACTALIKTLLFGTEMEKCLNYVERIYDFAAKIPEEPQDGISESELSNSWPSKGEISFKNVFMRYREDIPLALRNFNLNIRAGEKIGICGRTGAGKSSLLGCLFRLCEINSGNITIDGVDIGGIKLSTLRKHLSIIPQEAVLFEGTLRFNLDPYREYGDLELWEALRRCEASFKLDDDVSEEGANYSLGEQQLIALCRVLVKKTKIIALDEAVSCLDPEKYSEVQKILLRELDSCTVICIAHRLHSIISFDRIVVMDEGQALEVGTPMELLKKGGVFTAMCLEAGIEEADIANAN